MVKRSGPATLCLINDIRKQTAHPLNIAQLCEEKAAAPLPSSANNSRSLSSPFATRLSPN